MQGSDPQPFWSDDEEQHPEETTPVEEKVRQRQSLPARTSLAAEPLLEQAQVPAAREQGRGPSALAEGRADYSSARSSGSSAIGNQAESPPQRRRSTRNRAKGQLEEDEEEEIEVPTWKRASRREPAVLASSFRIDSWVRCLETTMLREEESLKSAKVAELSAGRQCTVLAHSERKRDSWLRVQVPDGSCEGWTRCCTSSNRPLLEACAPPERCCSDAGGSTGSRGSSPRDGREEMIFMLFRYLDDSQCGRLRSLQLRRYAEICGFQGSAGDWACEYRAMCQIYGLSEADGADAEDFSIMVNDTERQNHWTNEELAQLLQRVDLDESY